MRWMLGASSELILESGYHQLNIPRRKGEQSLGLCTLSGQLPVTEGTGGICSPPLSDWSQIDQWTSTTCRLGCESRRNLFAYRFRGAEWTQCLIPLGRIGVDPGGPRPTRITARPHRLQPWRSLLGHSSGHPDALAPRCWTIPTGGGSNTSGRYVRCHPSDKNRDLAKSFTWVPWECPLIREVSP